MAAPAVVSFRKIRPRFLEGLALAEINTIVSAAKQRRYLANSVIVNQGRSQDNPVLASAWRNLRRSSAVVAAFRLSGQHRSR
jgi:hypothetical protein